jgi:hypothetical protein
MRALDHRAGGVTSQTHNERRATRNHEIVRVRTGVQYSPECGNPNRLIRVYGLVMPRRLLFLFAVLAGMRATAQQKCVLEGVVTDFLTGEPLRKVTVRLLPSMSMDLHLCLCGCYK